VSDGEPIQVGQLHVEQDHGRPEPWHLIERGAPISGLGDDVETCHLQQVTSEGPEPVVVVDDEDGRWEHVAILDGQDRSGNGAGTRTDVSADEVVARQTPRGAARTLSAGPRESGHSRWRNHIMRRTFISAAIAMALTLATVAPAMAGGSRSIRFTWSDHYAVPHPCGIVEETAVTARGTAFFDASGAWIRDVVTVAYDGLYTGPSGSLSNQTHVTIEFTPDTGTFRGQGVFIHGGHIGTLVYDVGRLVFDASDGSTLFATPKVIPFDDPAAIEALDAALCDLLS
jgi:hypothetical protein